MRQLVSGHAVAPEQLRPDERRRLNAFAARVRPATLVLLEGQRLCERCQSLLPIVWMVAVNAGVGFGVIEPFRDADCPRCLVDIARAQVGGSR